MDHVAAGAADRRVFVIRVGVLLHKQSLSMNGTVNVTHPAHDAQAEKQNF
jgi:hypothetical protein